MDNIYTEYSHDIDKYLYTYIYRGQDIRFEYNMYNIYWFIASPFFKPVLPYWSGKKKSLLRIENRRFFSMKKIEIRETREETCKTAKQVRNREPTGWRAFNTYWSTRFWRS